VWHEHICICNKSPRARVGAGGGNPRVDGSALDDETDKVLRVCHMLNVGEIESG
jgi:hypothetical protein